MDNQNNERDEDRKKVVMATVRQILGFSKLSADLCRETPISNLRAVRRSAKNTKDPPQWSLSAPNIRSQ